MADCSELAKKLTDIAMNVSTEADVKNLDDVVSRMKKLLPGVNREVIVDAIVESTEGKAKQTDALVNKINEIKREARTDKTIQKQIANLKNFLEKGETLPKSKRKVKTSSDAIQELRKLRDNLKKKLAKSDPVQKKKLENQIKELQQRMSEGDIQPKQKIIETPKSKELERLEFKRDELRRDIQRRIQELKPKKVFEKIAEPFNVARSLITSFDLSAALRQGGFFTVANPIRARKAFAAMGKALVSEKGQVKIHQQIKDNKWAPLAAQAKLFIAPIDGTYKLSDMEEGEILEDVIISKNTLRN